MPAGDFPITVVIERVVPPVTTITADSSPIVDTVDLGAAGETGDVTAVTYTPNAAKSGAASPDTRTLTLYNRTLGGAGGTGTTKVAELALVSGVDLAAGVAKTITLQAAANLVVTHGDRLQWESTHILSGMTDPGGLLRITMVRD